MKFLDLDGLRKVWQEIKKDMSSKLGKENIIDNLDSTSTTDALSANQGKILNDKATKLVAEATLDVASNKLTVSGLDIIRDGGVYDIVIVESSATSSPGGHVLRVNDLTSGYHSSFIIASGAAQGATNLFRKEYVTTGLCYTNGWSQSKRKFYVTGTLIYYDANWIGFNGQSYVGSDTDNDYVNLVNGGAVINQNVENITSLNITASDGQIAAGSWIKVYKR